MNDDERKELDARWARKSEGCHPLEPDDFPAFVPEGFRRKCHFGYLLVEGDPTSERTYAALIAERYDGEDIDQDPIGVVFHSTGAGGRWSHLHHGDWPGRTRSAVSSSQPVRRYCPWREIQDTQLTRGFRELRNWRGRTARPGDRHLPRSHGGPRGDERDT